MNLNNDLIDIMKAQFPDNFAKQTTLKDSLEADDAKYKLETLLRDFKKVINDTYIVVENKELLCDHIKDLIVGIPGQSAEDISKRIFTILVRTESSIDNVVLWLNKLIDNINIPLEQAKSMLIPDVLFPAKLKDFKEKLNSFEKTFFESVYESQGKTIKDSMTLKQYNFMNKICLNILGHRFEEIVFTKDIKEEDIDSELE